MTTLTAADYQSAALGDSFRSILDIVELLREFDLSQLTELLGIVGKISEVSDLKEAVQLGLQAFKIIAEMTPTDADNKIVAVIESILSDELLDVITKIVGGFLGQEAQATYGIAATSGSMFALTAAEKTDLEAKGIPVSFLFDIALKLLPLLQRFLDRE